MTRYLLLLLCLLAPWLGRASESEATAGHPRVDDLAWMAGDWRSEDGDRLAQEVWTSPRAGSMTGMFRLVSGGRVRVLEYIVVADEGGDVFYQFKHYRPDYTTWEGTDPPIRMKLVALEAGHAVFENTVRAEGQPAYITYRLGEDGRLSVFVGDRVGASGEYQGFMFVLSKENPTPPIPVSSGD